MKQPAVYIVSNKARTVLYTGVASNLVQRTGQHKAMLMDGFAKRYRCIDLIFYELAENMEAAILREKQIKAYRRQKKMALIFQQNPEFSDLYAKIL